MSQIPGAMDNINMSQGGERGRKEVDQPMEAAVADDMVDLGGADHQTSTN